MIVTTEGVNLNLLRGMRVPVAIWKEGIAHEFTDDTVSQNDMDPEDDSEKYKDKEQQLEYDKNLSGLYIVNSLKFIYDATIQGGTRWKTESTMSRASWSKNSSYSN